MTALVLAAAIAHAAATEHVPVRTLAAMAWHESRWGAHTIGQAGEYGPMQLHPRGWGTMFCAGIDTRGVFGNVTCAARVLARLKRKCGTWKRALGAYNGGGCKVSLYARKVGGL